MKEADPEFYRDASSLQYGKVYYQNIDIFFQCLHSITIHFFVTSGLSFHFRHQKSQRRRLTEWYRSSRIGKRSASHLAGEEGFTKRRISTQSMTVMSISTRKSSEPLGNTRWRLKIILSEELHYLTKVMWWNKNCSKILNGGLHFLECLLIM